MIIATVIIVSTFFVYDTLKSESLYNDAFEISCVNGIEYQSEHMDIGNNTVFVYAALNDNSSEYNTDEFIVCVGGVKGILNNKYRIYSYREIPDGYILNPDIRNIVNIPEYSLKKGTDYYGSVFVGIAPLDCKSIVIDGVNSHLKRMSFEINGNQVNFNLYYCVVPKNEYSDNVDFVYINNDNQKFSVQTHDGEEYSEVIKIE